MAMFNISRTLSTDLPAENQGDLDQSKSMRWSSEADEILARVPAKHQRQVARDIEKLAEVNRGTEVCWTPCMYNECRCVLLCTVVEG